VLFVCAFVRILIASSVQNGLHGLRPIQDRGVPLRGAVDATKENQKEICMACYSYKDIIMFLEQHLCRTFVYPVRLSSYLSVLVAEIQPCVFCPDIRQFMCQTPRGPTWLSHIERRTSLSLILHCTSTARPICLSTLDTIQKPKGKSCAPGEFGSQQYLQFLPPDFQIFGGELPVAVLNRIDGRDAEKRKRKESEIIRIDGPKR
jgi:hypothetical protein